MNIFEILFISFYLISRCWCQKLLTKNCIQKHKNLRIVGGIDTTENETPYIVSLTRRGGHICGATIINENWLLTAAHCLCNGFNNRIIKPSHIKGIVALHKISDYSKEREKESNKSHLPYEIEFKSIIIHPKYDCNFVNDDIALLEFSKTISFTNRVKPACISIATTNEIDERNEQDVKGTIFGWGWTNENQEIGKRADILQKASVKIWQNDKCQKSFKENGMKNLIMNTQMCAGYENGGIDSCWADSGGPLLSENFLIGIVSTGVGCARPGLPGIYTRVNKYTNWILSVILNKKD